MVSLQTSTNLSSISRTSVSSNKSIIKSALSVPKYLKFPKITVPKLPNHAQKQQFVEELNKLNNLQLRELKPITSKPEDTKNSTITIKLYAVLEAVSDRIEMHQNIGNQRENWNSLLLNSVNMITLTAVTMAGLAEASGPNGLGLKVSSALFFAAGTGILLIMNKIQPSQLVEEQRNAVRLFKKLRTNIQTTLAIRTPSQEDVEEAMTKVLALDRAYPLPLLGAMLDKYPESLEPAKWWPSKKQSTSPKHNCSVDSEQNGWTRELEEDIREILGVTKKKDIEDYVRLGNKALKLSKVLAVSGPLLTGVAAVGAACVGHGGPWGGLVAAVAGSMAAAVNTIEHGGQVGMVFEMYRNCAGFFKLLEETVGSTLDEEDLDKRENGEVFELKMALQLGRSLPEFRDFADKSRRIGGSVDGFASKLF